jgi:hypothetical protein
VEENCSIEVMVEAYTDAFQRAVEGRFPGPSMGLQQRIQLVS